MISATNFNVPLEDWTQLMELVAPRSGKYIYQVYTPSENQLSVSYEVLAPSEFAEKCQALFDKSIANVHPNLLATSKKHTRKLSLYEVLSYTNTLLRQVNFNDENTQAKASQLFNKTFKPEETINVEAILDESLGSYGRLSTALSKFHDNNIVRHRSSYSGYAREFISLIFNIFKGCFKGNQTFYNETVAFVKQGKKTLANCVYQPLSKPLDLPPPYTATPRKQDSPITPPKTPITMMTNNNYIDQNAGDTLRRIRTALENYIGLTKK